MLRETVAYLQAHGECPVPSALGELRGRAGRGRTCTSTRSDPNGSPRCAEGVGRAHTVSQSSETHQPRPPSALTTEGIFRRSANTQIVREVQHKYNMGEWPPGVC